MITETTLTVRYAETDQMGIVHHAVYPIWFEAARTDFLKQAGMSYSEMELSGFSLPLIELRCTYKSPAHYGEDIIVTTRIIKMTHVKVVFEYKVIQSESHLFLSEGATTHVWVNKLFKPVNLAKSSPKLFNAIKELCDIIE